MIERITNPERFEMVVNDISDLLEVDSGDNKWHELVPNNRESFISAYAHKGLLAHKVFAWANKNKKNKYDALIVFLETLDPRSGEKMFVENVWLSGNPKVGAKLFFKAIDFARKSGYKYITAGRSVKSPNSESVKRFYEKLGFIKDSESYIAQI